MKIQKSFFGVAKYSCIIFFILLLITTIVFLGFFAQELRSQKKIMQASENQYIKLLQKIIENEIKVNAYNLIFLSNHTKLHKWLNSREEKYRSELIDLFHNLCKKAERYDHMRFIDYNGMEQIRTGHRDGEHISVPKNQLQNKADRYYFQKTIKLKLSQVFISPFDLNIEHGQIEHPFKPMIRFGMPVHDFNGRKVGIVLLNYLGEKLLNKLEAVSTSSHGSIMLINSDGFWLKALQPEDEWGFMFQDRQNKKISLENPDAWDKIIQQNRGQFIVEKGIYSFATIQITDFGMFSSSGSDNAFKSHKNNFSDKNFYWKIVSVIPKSVLKNLSLTIVFNFLPLYALVVMIMFVISCWLGFTINHRLYTQRSLDQNEAELRSLFRSVPAGIGMVNNRVITQANHQLCKMTGYTQSELLGKNARIFYPSDGDFEFVGREKYRQIKKKGTGSVETYWKCKNGKIINVLLSSTPLKINDLTAGVTFSAFDITLRKKAEEQLAASQERYRTIIETASDGIFTINPNLKFTSINTALEKLTEQKRDDWIGKPVFDMIRTKHLKAANRLFNYVLEGKEFIAHKFEINTAKPGIYKVCECTLKPKYNKDDVIIGIVGFVQDLTDFQKATIKVQRVEKQLRQSQKMEAVGTLAGGIAHDFNNILSGIFGYAQLAEMNQEGPEKTKQYIGQIVKAAQRATTLIQQILTFSRQTEYQKKPLMISITIKEALKLLRASIPSNIDIKQDVFSKAVVMADPTQVHQVIMNLCTNAYHAMQDTGGVLTVGLKEIQILEKDSIPELKMLTGKYLKLEVSDTGHGIDKNILEKVFDPYFSTKEPGKGTGLGLALVQAIVDEHNGFLKVDTELGKGTSFYIYLPIIEKLSQPKTISSIAASLLRGSEKIMFVDDEKFIRLSFKKLLEQYGYKVSIYKDGKEALIEFKKSPDKFDLIITDMTMPGITGDVLSTKLLEIKPDLPIILCTGYSAQIPESKAMELGIKKYIEKPVDSAKLAQLIRDIFDNH